MEACQLLSAHGLAAWPPMLELWGKPGLGAPLTRARSRAKSLCLLGPHFAPLSCDKRVNLDSLEACPNPKSLLLPLEDTIPSPCLADGCWVWWEGAGLFL